MKQSDNTLFGLGEEFGPKLEIAAEIRNILQHYTFGMNTFKVELLIFIHN